MLLLLLLVKVKMIGNQQLGCAVLCVALAPSSQHAERAGGQAVPWIAAWPKMQP